MASLIVDAVQIRVPAFALRYLTPVSRSRSTNPIVPGRVAKYCSAVAMRRRMSHWASLLPQTAFALGCAPVLAVVNTMAIERTARARTRIGLQLISCRSEVDRCNTVTYGPAT